MAVTGQIQLQSCPSVLGYNQEIRLVIDGVLYDSRLTAGGLWRGHFDVAGNGIERELSFYGFGVEIGPESPATVTLGYMPEADVQVSINLYGETCVSGQVPPWEWGRSVLVDSRTITIKFSTTPPPNGNGGNGGNGVQIPWNWVLGVGGVIAVGAGVLLLTRPKEKKK